MKSAIAETIGMMSTSELATVCLSVGIAALLGDLKRRYERGGRMSEDEFYKKAQVVKLDTLSDVNDIGKPWRYEEDGLTVTRTSPWSPPGCHPVGCGLKLYANDDGRLVKVEGNENNPVTQGRLCPRCIALKDYIYNPARLLEFSIR